jgi:hypothetical protein
MAKVWPEVWGRPVTPLPSNMEIGKNILGSSKGLDGGCGPIFDIRHE